VLAGAIVAGLTGAIHAVLVVTLKVNQKVSGLAITIFAGAAGLSSYLANTTNVAERPAPHQFERLDVLGLQDAPIVGPLLFHQNVLTYASWVLVAALSWFLFGSRTGLHLRAVGESPETADTLGIPVVRYRYLHPIAGGALAGVGGVFLGALYFASPTAGDLPLLQALIVVVLGGLGSLTGTLYAAYLVGLMQAFCEVEIGTTWTLPILYTAILIILVIRPYGLKGSPSEARL
jgi:ABC-type uncharacterized transport system permease subunit